MPGILVLFISYLGCDITLVLVVWFFAVTLITAAYAGAMANIVDIAPNFAGPVLAFAQTIHMTASFVSPQVGFALLGENGLYYMSSWCLVFYVTAFVSVGTYVVYQIWGTGEVRDVCEINELGMSFVCFQIQSWNNYRMPTSITEQEELMKQKQVNGDEIFNGNNSKLESNA